MACGCFTMWKKERRAVFWAEVIIINDGGKMTLLVGTKNVPTTDYFYI